MHELRNELRNYTHAYVGRSLVICRQKWVDLFRGLLQSLPANCLLYTVNNIVSYVLFLSNSALYEKQSH
jgi:hypothetical protein